MSSKKTPYMLSSIAGPVLPSWTVIVYSGVGLPAVALAAAPIGTTSSAAAARPKRARVRDMQHLLDTGRTAEHMSRRPPLLGPRIGTSPSGDTAEAASTPARGAH